MTNRDSSSTEQEITDQIVLKALLIAAGVVLVPYWESGRANYVQ